MASKRTILGLWLFFSALAFGAPALAAVQMESLAVGYSSLLAITRRYGLRWRTGLAGNTASI
jgi:hypothetical protein